MAEEYRLSVGIDASDATEGAVVWKGATLEIIRYAEQATEHVYQLEEGFKKVTKAADGTVVVEYSRNLEALSSPAKDGAKHLDDLADAATSATATLKSLVDDGGSGTQALKELSNWTGTATDGLREYADTSAQALRRVGADVGGLADSTAAAADAMEDVTDATKELRKAAGGAVLGQLPQRLSALPEAFDAVAASVEGVTNNIDTQARNITTLAGAYDAAATAIKDSGDFGAAQLIDTRDAAAELARAAEDAGAALEGLASAGRAAPVADWDAVGNALRQVVAASNSTELAIDKANDSAASLAERISALPQIFDETAKASAAHRIEMAQALRDIQIDGEVVRERLDRMRDATDGFSDALAISAQEFANVGDAAQAARLFEMSDQFRELETHIADALEPGSEMLKQFADAAGLTREEVRELYNTFGTLIADITDARLSFEQGDLTISEYAGRIEELRARIADLTPELAELRSNLQIETNAEDAAKEIEEMLEKLGGSQKSLDEFSNAQERAGLTGEFLNNSMTTLGVSAGKLGGMFLRAIGLTGVTALFYKSFTGANEFSDALARLTNMAALTTEQTAELKQELKEMGAEFGNSSTEEAAAMLAVMSRGYRDVAEAATILAEANTLADATFTSVGTAAASLAQAMAAFEMDASEAKQAADTLAVASGGSAEAMQQMAFMAGRLGATMNQAGVSLKDYAVAVSALRQGGMENRRAILGLTQVVQSLANMTVEASLRFEQYGIVVNKARIANEGLAPIIQEIFEKTKGNKAAIQELMGSQQAATVVMALMRDNGELLADALDRQANSAKLAAEQAEVVNNTFGKQLGNLAARLLDRFKSLGSYLGDGLVPVLKALNENVGLLYKALLTIVNLVAVVTVMKTFSMATKLFSAEVTRANLALLGTRTAMGQYVISMGLGARATSVMTAASIGMTKAVAGTVGVLRGMLGLIGGLPGLLTTAAVALITFSTASSDVGDGMKNLRLETEAYRATLVGLNETQLALERNDLQKTLRTQTAAMWEARREVDRLREARDTAVANMSTGTGRQQEAAGGRAMQADRALVEAEELYTRIKTTVDETAGKLRNVEDATADVRTALKEAADAASDMNASFSKQVTGLVEADPVFALRKQRDELAKLRSAVDADTSLDPQKKADAMAAIARKTEELAVASAQLAQKKGPMAEYFQTIMSAASPASAALYAYTERVRQLDQARSMGLDKDEYQRQLMAATVAYQEASRASEVYRQEVQSVAQAVAPAEEALRAYADAAFVAAKASVGGASGDAVREYMRQQEVTMQRSLDLIALENDAMGKLAERYDPLVKNERERARAIIEARAEVERLIPVEEDRAAVMGRITAEISNQYDLQAQLIKLEGDGLTSLMAKYDPLLQNELDRTRALIEMEAAVRRLQVSDEERLAVAGEIEEAIQRQYDRQAREITGQITLADAWKKAWESAIERVDNSFAELWKSAFDGMDSLVKQLKDTAKQLVAEIAHAKITRPLIMGLGRRLSGEPEPGKVFGDGMIGKFMDRLTGARQENPAGVMATHQTAVAAIRDGFVAGYAATGGMPGSQSFERALAGFGESLGFNLEGFGSIGTDISAKIEEAFGSLSLDGLTDGFRKAVAGVMPMLVGENGGGAGGTAQAVQQVLTQGQSGGLMSQLSNLQGFQTLAKGLTKLSTTFAAFSSGFQGGLGAFFGGTPAIASTSIGGAGTGALGAYAGAGAQGAGVIAGQAIGGAGVGALGGMATDYLLGSRGDAGRNMAMSAVGGVIGSFWGPVGSLVGGAIGSLVDNMIGGGKEIKDFGVKIAAEGRSLIGEEYTKIKKYGSMFSSKTVTKTEEWDDPAFKALRAKFKEFTAQLEEVAKALDVSTEALANFRSGTIKVSTKGKDEGQINAEIEQALTDVQGRQIAYFLSNTSALPDEMMALLNSFKLTGKEMMEFNPELKKAGKEFKNATHFTAEYVAAFQQLVMLQAAMNAIPSVKGAEMVAEANKTATQRYFDLADAAVKASEQFDGSIEDIAKLTTAFVAQRQAAVELAAALLTTQEQIKGMFADTALSIRESLMGPQELYDFRKQRTEDLAAQMTTVTDPAKLQQMASEINSLVNSLYQSLDETQRQAMAPEFLSFLDGVSAIVDQQTQAGLNALDESAASVNEQVSAAMLAGMEQQGILIAQQAQSTSQFANAVGVFARAAEAIASWSGQQPSAPTTGFAASTPVKTASTRPAGTGFSGFNAAREVNA